MRRIKSLTITNSFVAILFLLIFAFLSFERFHAAAVEENRDDLGKCMLTFRELLRQKGTGFGIADGKILTGSYVINGNFEVPDKVQEIFGETATVFMGDVRVSTNVRREDGSRAVGTRLEGAAYDAIFKQGKAFRGETRILGVPYLTAYDPIRDSNGKIIGALYVGMKKSDFLAHYSVLKIQLVLILLGLLAVFSIFLVLFSRLTKKADREKEADHKFLLDIIQFYPDATMVIDSGGKVVAWNLAMEELSGVRAEEILGKGNYEYALPFYGERRPILIDLAMQTALEVDGKYNYIERRNETLIGEAYIKNVRGGQLYFHGTAAPLINSSGEIIGAIESIRDISERKQMEEELKKSRDVAEESAQRLEYVLEGSSDATWEWDILVDQGVINTKYYEMTEYSPEEENLNFAFFVKTIHPDDASEVQRRMQEHLEGKTGEYKADFRLVTKSGKLKDVMMRGKIVRYDEAGRPSKMAGVVTDVTEMKKLADEVSRMHNLESIGLLAGGLAHDFNNVLNIIHGNISFARMLVLGDSAIAEPLTDAEEACERAKELGIRLQALSQGSSMVKEPIALTAIIEDVEEALFKGSNISLTLAAAANLLPVEADPRQIRQLFESLLTNAKEAMSDGGTVKIDIENYLADGKTELPLVLGRYVSIVIEDDGKGIPEEHLPKLFNPYFSTKDTYSQRGMGLGLTICHAILKKHKGHIFVESKLGVGARVAVYLPSSVEVPLA